MSAAQPLIVTPFPGSTKQPEGAEGVSDGSGLGSAPFPFLLAGSSPTGGSSRSTPGAYRPTDLDIRRTSASASDGSHCSRLTTSSAA